MLWPVRLEHTRASFVSFRKLGERTREAGALIIIVLVNISEGRNKDGEGANSSPNLLTTCPTSIRYAAFLFS